MNKIKGIYLEITDACDKNCPYCYNASSRKNGRKLEVETIKEFITDLLDNNIHYITLSGGEPFLHPDIKEIFRLLHSYNINISVISNGYVFNFIDLIRQYSPNIQLTFDGNTAELHDSSRGAGNYEVLTNGIKCLFSRPYEGSIDFRINLFSNNVESLQLIMEKVSEIVSENKIKKYSLYVSLVHENNNFHSDAVVNQNVYSELARIVDEWNEDSKKVKALYEFTNPDIGCPYNGSDGSIECGLRINSNGDVFPCQLFDDSQFIIGNIKDSSLADIISSQRISDFIRQISARKENHNCKKCVYKSVCGAGCPAANFNHHMTLEPDSNDCVYRKEYFRRMIVDGHK